MTYNYAAGYRAGGRRRALASTRTALHNSEHALSCPIRNVEDTENDTNSHPHPRKSCTVALHGKAAAPPNTTIHRKKSPTPTYQSPSTNEQQQHPLWPARILEWGTANTGILSLARRRTDCAMVIRLPSACRRPKGNGASYLTGCIYTLGVPVTYHQQRTNRVPASKSDPQDSQPNGRSWHRSRGNPEQMYTMYDTEQVHVAL
jgi:hypothetical protein